MFFTLHFVPIPRRRGRDLLNGNFAKVRCARRRRSITSDATECQGWPLNHADMIWQSGTLSDFPYCSDKAQTFSMMRLNLAVELFAWLGRRWQLHFSKAYCTCTKRAILNCITKLYVCGTVFCFLIGLWVLY